jgi:hypothetical protein
VEGGVAEKYMGGNARGYIAKTGHPAIGALRARKRMGTTAIWREVFFLFSLAAIIGLTEWEPCIPSAVRKDLQLEYIQCIYLDSDALGRSVLFVPFPTRVAKAAIHGQGPLRI